MKSSKEIISFQLGANQEYIELNKLLKITGLVGTGGEANVRISDGEVKVNGMYATEKRKKIRAKDQVIFDAHLIEVVSA